MKTKYKSYRDIPVDEIDNAFDPAFSQQGFRAGPECFFLTLPKGWVKPLTFKPLKNNVMKTLKNKIALRNFKKGGILIKEALEYRIIDEDDAIEQYPDQIVTFENNTEAYTFIEEKEYDALEPFQLNEWLNEVPPTHKVISRTTGLTELEGSYSECNSYMNKTADTSLFDINDPVWDEDGKYNAITSN